MIPTRVLEGGFICTKQNTVYKCKHSEAYEM